MFVDFSGFLIGPTVWWGFWAIILGVISAGIFYRIVLSFNSLTDQELSIALTKIFKSLPKILGPIAYISGASLRCIMKTGGETAFEQCWNPYIPTIYLTWFFALGWFVAYVLAPIARHKENYTWSDVMRL